MSRFNSLIWSGRLPGADPLNHQLAQAFNALRDDDFERRSHFIDGRFENLYLTRTKLPGVDRVLSFARQQALALLSSHRADWLEAPIQAETRLRIGFWLNAMEPGQRTSSHNHDEADELCSGVYYVSVAPGSGDIFFHDGPFETRVQPTPGMMLLFSPALLHSVEANRSQSRRLSIAFNIGPDEDN